MATPDIDFIDCRHIDDAISSRFHWLPPPDAPSAFILPSAITPLRQRFHCWLYAITE
jgi:hypothetical protein